MTDRHNYTFEEYDEIGYDAEWDTWGVHGTNIYYNGHYVGEVAWKTPQDFEEMTDEEFEETLNENGIII